VVIFKLETKRSKQARFALIN